MNKEQLNQLYYPIKNSNNIYLQSKQMKYKMMANQIEQLIKEIKLDKTIHN